MMVPWATPDAAWARLETVPLPPVLEMPAQVSANPCFAAGTRILAERGDMPVEDLAVGDFAITADNELAKIIWIGRRDLDLTRHPRPELVRPVRISAGALAMGVPERDLVVSPDHGLYFDGSLVQAKDLIDGVVIRQDFDLPQIRYYHVELEAHGILLAEGAGAESYLDTGHRGVFGNASSPVILPQEIMQARRETDSAAPLVTGGEELAAIRARLHGRKLMLGLAIAESHLCALKIGADLLPPSESTSGQVSFLLPPETTEAIFCSPVFTPAEIDPASNDRRRLGVALSEIFVDGKLFLFRNIVNEKDLHRRNPRETSTWTSGALRLNIPPGAKTLTFAIAAFPKLWRPKHGFST
jgi:hypothetical protein